MLRRVRRYLIDLLSEPGDEPAVKWDEPVIPEHAKVQLPPEITDGSIHNELWHHGNALNYIIDGVNRHHFASGRRFGVLDNKVGFIYGIFFTAIAAAVAAVAREVWVPILHDLMGVFGL